MGRDSIDGDQMGFYFPNTHTDDPDSSRMAEARSKPTWQQKYRFLLATLRKYPGLTATQIAEQLSGQNTFGFPPGFHRYQEVRRRLSDLGPKGTGELHRIHTKGDTESRWFVA